jgi:hypothetical protein
MTPASARRALWPAALCAALTGRTHGCTEMQCDVKISLANSEPYKIESRGR